LSDEKDERRVLFEYWRDMPLIQIHDVPSEIMESHRVRPAIMKILRAGIPDEKESGRLRHALNTKEIRRTLLDRDGIKMSQHNLYFHLNKLEEIGYIKVVARLLEGRHKVAYYGRTARSILRRDTEESLEKYEKWFQEMGRLSKSKRPEFDMDRLEGLAEEYLGIMRRRDRAQGEWMASNEESIYEGGIDSYSIFGLLQTLDVMDPELIGFIKKVRELFEVDL
jgi:DNA-binding MarR family transcriptional regulator